MLRFAPADLTQTRQIILTTLKRRGPVTIDALARSLRLTHEAVRRHIVQLRQEGWVQRCKPRRQPKKKGGRPPGRYCLSVAGDHLFPKHYDRLTLDLLKAITRNFGRRAMLNLFAAMADDTVADWKPAVRGKSLPKKLQVLRKFYAKMDRSTLIQRSGEDYQLIERNCPFLNVSMEHPELCSVTVNVLTRLVGLRVIRTERYQNGDGRCVFRVFEDQPSKLTRFALEPAIP